jgi:hypothetical protein
VDFRHLKEWSAQQPKYDLSTYLTLRQWNSK